MTQLDRPTFEQIYMNLAFDLSRRSTCGRMKVGCAIVSPDFTRVIAVGYNGNVPGGKNDCDLHGPEAVGRCGCFPSGTRVSAVGVQRAYRRWYEGSLVRVITAHGEFAATPNHPVLAPGRGWVTAQALAKGDYLIRASGGEDVTPSTPYDYHGVPIEHVFETIRVSGSHVRRAGARHQFHGDGVVDQDVDIVSTTGSLPSDEQTGLFEKASEPRLSAPLGVPARFRGACPGRQYTGASHDRSYVADRRDSTSTQRSPDNDSGDDQALSDRCDTDLERAGKRDSGLTSLISTDDLLGGEIKHRFSLVPAEVLGHAAKYASGSEATLNGGVSHTDARCDIHHGFPTRVPADEIVHVEWNRWSGHVFNLQTKANWFTLADTGSVAHNCLHAEENAIINCDVPKETPKVLLCTHLPCVMCAKRIVRVGGVQRVIYATEYRNQDAVDILCARGISLDFQPRTLP